MSGIAARYGTDVTTLQRLNGIRNPDRIDAGQFLRLPSSATTHTVRSGDTLSEIARAHGVGTLALARANGIADPDRIAPGQVLRIPSAAAIQSAVRPPASGPPANDAATPGGRLGALSERYESGGRGPGTISSGSGDLGGVSYGVYQLSSNAGTLRNFLANEGARWAERLGAPGGASFNTLWRAIAAAEPQAFREAQHAFIERTHYAPAVTSVRSTTRFNLSSRHAAVRDVTWSVSVQHAGSARILSAAVRATDAQHPRGSPDYDRALITNVYAERTRYVLAVANGSGVSAAERRQLIGVTQNRYPSERRDALAMLDGAARTGGGAAEAGGTVDGRAIAREVGVEVKSRSVRLDRLDASMVPVIRAVADAARRMDLPTPVITSGNDSLHKRDSLHYENRALDFRGRNITVAEGRRLEAEVARLLGPDYDVIFETFSNASNNHLHVEYQPN